MSARSTIRDGIKNKLTAATVGGGLLAGWSIQTSRVDPFDDAEPGASLPDTLNVYAPEVTGETLDPENYGGAFCVADVVVVKVDAIFAGGTGAAIEAKLDAVEAAIETVLFGDQSWLNTFARKPERSAASAVYTQGGKRRGALFLDIRCHAPAVEV